MGACEHARQERARQACVKAGNRPQLLHSTRCTPSTHSRPQHAQRGAHLFFQRPYLHFFLDLRSSLFLPLPLPLLFFLGASSSAPSQLTKDQLQQAGCMERTWSSVRRGAMRGVCGAGAADAEAAQLQRQHSCPSQRHCVYVGWQPVQQAGCAHVTALRSHSKPVDFFRARLDRSMSP